MAEQKIKSYLQFRRGTLAEWDTINPVLKQGEPGFAYDYHILKIGDGTSTWQELDYQNIAYVVDAPTVEGFPIPGDTRVLYKASETKEIYQWNDTTQEYESLLSGQGKVTADDLDIELIHGGNANG